MPSALPSFDLVLATVGRTDELADFLESLRGQSHRAFRLLLVDQNDDDRLEPLLTAFADLPIVRLQSARGLSRARNIALGALEADLVAFPDDDCLYPPDLLERVATRFAGEPSLSGLTGRAAERSGASAPSWKTTGALLTRTNLWNRAISFTIFLRRELVEDVGRFDERLGLGSGSAAASGEEIDYLVRVVGRGARIVYDPELVVWHPIKQHAPAEARAIAHRDGASVGVILRKHHYGPATLARMIVRPAGGAALALARRDVGQARVHLATLRGRLRGLLGG